VHQTEARDVEWDRLSLTIIDAIHANTCVYCAWVIIVTRIQKHSVNTTICGHVFSFEKVFSNISWLVASTRWQRTTWIESVEPTAEANFMRLLIPLWWSPSYYLFEKKENVKHFFLLTIVFHDDAAMRWKRWVLYSLLKIRMSKTPGSEWGWF